MESIEMNVDSHDKNSGVDILIENDDEDGKDENIETSEHNVQVENLTINNMKKNNEKANKSENYIDLSNINVNIDDEIQEDQEEKDIELDNIEKDEVERNQIEKKESEINKKNENNKNKQNIKTNNEDNNDTDGQGNTFIVSTGVPGPLYLRLRPSPCGRFIIVNNYDRTPYGAKGDIERQNLVKPGDRLIGINGEMFDGKSFKEAIGIIKKYNDVLVRNLIFQRPSTPPPLIQVSQAKRRTSYTEIRKYDILVKLLDENNLSLSSLREITSKGIPEHGHLRGILWRILLSYLPLDRSLWDNFLMEHRHSYKQFKSEFGSNLKIYKEFLLLGNEDNNIFNEESFVRDDLIESDAHLLAETIDDELWEEISKDVIRTHPDLRFLTNKKTGKYHLNKMKSILYIYAKLNPGVRYVQGMNEVLGTLYYVIASDHNHEWSDHAEADTFFCFTNLMSELRDVYIQDLDNSDKGIQGKILYLNKILKTHDPELFYHLSSISLDAHFYALRWITTLLSREFSLTDTIYLWDGIFSTSQRSEYICYLCCTMLLTQREILLTSDFSMSLQHLQNFPPISTSRLLERSKALRKYDHKQAARLLKQYKERERQSLIEEHRRRIQARIDGTNYIEYKENGTELSDFSGYSHNNNNNNNDNNRNNYNLSNNTQKREDDIVELIKTSTVNGLVGMKKLWEDALN